MHAMHVATTWHPIDVIYENKPPVGRVDRAYPRHIEARIGIASSIVHTSPRRG